MAYGRLILIRHGETAWSLSGQHTGRSDIPLTADGEARARALAPMMAGLRPAQVRCSPLSRARATCQAAGLTPTDIDDDLLEWDYGAYEGLTTADIRQMRGDPSWTIWAGTIPAGDHSPGEQPEDVAVRAGRVIERCAPDIRAGRDCILVAHGHLLRILTATWLGLPAVDGRLWALDAGAVSLLGFERDQRVISAWNLPAPEGPR
ncbi:MAG: histidine phosphatase family protein [bacterium]